MDDCVFCNIISGKMDAYIVYENKQVCCFLDKCPINKGHVLVVPKRHVPEFSTADEKSLCEVILAAKKIAEALEETLDTDGITVMQNNGIFKDVEHYHMHVIPRYRGDGFSWIEPESKVNREDFIDIGTRLQKYFH